MVALRYFPATETENNGITEHEDGNCFTFVVQDEAGGLEVNKNGEWIPVIPEEGKIVVNVGDVIQVNSKLQKFNYSLLPVKNVSPFGREVSDQSISPFTYFNEYLLCNSQLHSYIYVIHFLSLSLFMKGIHNIFL